MKRPGYLILTRTLPDADPAIVERARRRPGLRVVVENDGFVVLVEKNLEVREGEDGPIVLGAVLGQSGNDVPSDFTALTRRAWGAYVAIDKDDGGRQVLRDPSGRMPCLSVLWRGWRMFAPELEDFGALGWKASGIDWQTLGEFLQHPRMRDGRTALQGVAEILPGEAMNEAGERSIVWAPSMIAREELDNFEDGRDLVQTAVRHAVSAWAARTPRILHLLSGGLDSSIVLACIAECGLADRVRCLHFTRGAGSELDEARYAREIAERAGVDLVQRTFNPRAVRLERAGDLVNAPRPLGYAYSIENDDWEVEAADAWNASACFSAAGGDGLFYQLQAKVYCADYLRRHGFGPGLARVAYDSARLIRSSVWSTLNQGLRFSRNGFDPDASVPNMYLAERVGAGGRGWFARHPWGRAAAGLAPGKQLHIWALLDTLNFTYDYRRSQTAETILPLVSQPVIEAVLQIPSYLLSCKGTDRTLVREAFSDRLPASIVNRRGKGAMDGYYAELCAANATLIRERLLGGRLAAAKLLDTARIEQAMPRTGEPADGAETHLLKLFAAEVWAEAW